jgi:hypothetical protein
VQWKERAGFFLSSTNCARIVGRQSDCICVSTRKVSSSLGLGPRLLPYCPPLNAAIAVMARLIKFLGLETNRDLSATADLGSP